MSHPAVREALLERHAEPLEARARLLDVGHGDGDVAEPLRVGVARVVWRRVQLLRTMIVSEFEDAFAIETVCRLLGIRGLAARAVKGEEVEREVTKFEFVDKIHPYYVCIEWK